MEADAVLRDRKEAVLVLEDGSSFRGFGFGSNKEVSGEVVFSTSMVGYPEALTDPSYHGQILALTYPLVGNYGVPSCEEEELGLPKYFESKGIRVMGFIVHELCHRPSHWASEGSLDEWLSSEGIPGIYGIDTRRLTKKLRKEGVMLGILKVCDGREDIELDKLMRNVETVQDPNQRDLAGEVSVEEPIYHGSGGGKRVVLVDCGVKFSILRTLLKRGLEVVRVPNHFSSGEVMEYNPDGLVISNGPGDPKRCGEAIDCVRDVMEEGVPSMGICLGTQIMALAQGGDTYKLKYGHRSQNQPALDLEEERCYITTQNHGYAVDPDSLEGTGLKVRYINANDETVEGVEHEEGSAFAIQWHPEASPGPYDTEFLFERFLGLLR
jgi:carbamoyl-phosphate synthase small subunit